MMGEASSAEVVVPAGEMTNEVSAGASGDPAAFDREGHAMARRAISPDLLREFRLPIFKAMTDLGLVEPDADDEDRLIWTGEDAQTLRTTPLGVDVQELVNEMLVRPGVLSGAVSAAWGRPAAMWDGWLNLYKMVPGDPCRVHRDGWPMMAASGPENHFKVWLPLTRLDLCDGPLAVAAGTQFVPDGPPEVPVPHPMHLDVLANNGNMPPADVLAPRWRASGFEVGDMLIFRADGVHSTLPNNGRYLRMAIALVGQDPRAPLPPAAGLSLDPCRELTEVEWLTLAMLAIQPMTLWLASQAFYPRGVLRRLGHPHPEPKVGRSFATLEARGLIEPYPDDPERDRSGLHRYSQATAAGRDAVAAWLTAPVPVSSDLLAAKMLFADWLGLDRDTLLSAQ